MLLALYTACAIVLMGVVLFMMLHLIIRKSPQVMLCTECQQCNAACPLLSKGCNPMDIMLAAKSGQIESATEKGASLCVGCCKCQEVCPRGLAPYREAKEQNDMQSRKLS